MLRQGSALTLWEDALPPSQIPKYPSMQLLRAKGGETTHYIAEELRISEARSICRVEPRTAEPGELLRDPEMKFLPDWTENLRYRVQVLAAAESDPKVQQTLRVLCKSSILFWCNTFAWCYEPRAVDPEKRNIPFVTFEFQDEVLTWMVWCILMRKEGIIEKSRDMGATWMLVAVIDWLSIFYPGNTSYLTSLREEDVDNRQPDSLFGKLRFMHSRLPPWMQVGWAEGREGVDRQLNITFPDSQAYIRGQKVESTGGRQGRATVVGVDEFAHVAGAMSALAAFSALAPTIFYISTPQGPGNPFAMMAREPGANKQTLHWRRHPLKNEEWRRVESGKPKYFNSAIWAQEHEIQYETSKTGRVYEQLVSLDGPGVVWCHLRRDDLVKYDPHYDVYSVSDLGWNDPCSTLFFQIKPIPSEFHSLLPQRRCMVIFAEYEGRNMTPYCLRWYLNSRGFHYRDNVVDARTAGQADAFGKTWFHYLKDPGAKSHVSKHFGRVLEVGPPIIAKGRRTWEKTTDIRQSAIDLSNQLLALPGVIAINADACPHLITSMQAWSYPVDPETQEKIPGSSPAHDPWSHAGKAFCYGVDWVSTELLAAKDTPQEKESTDWSRLHTRQARFR